MLLRSVLASALAVVLGAAALGAGPRAGFPSAGFGERLLWTALLGGPGFLIGGLVLAILVDVQEAASTGPWVIRLTTLIFGVAFGVANLLFATFVAGFLLGPFGMLAVPLLPPAAAAVGGVGLGLGSQLGIRRRAEGGV